MTIHARHGASLVELIVVVVLLAILGTATLGVIARATCGAQGPAALIRVRAEHSVSRPSADR